MSNIPDIVKQRAIVGALALAIIPWVLCLIFLFLAKMFLGALVAAKDILIIGGAILAGLGAFATIQDRNVAPKLIGGVLAALLVGFLMTQLIALCVSGLSSLNRTIDSTLNAFLWFAGFGALGGSLIGAAIGYFEDSSGRNIFERSAPSIGRPRPNIIDHVPPGGLGYQPNAATMEPIDREPLNPAMGIYRCNGCTRQYHRHNYEQFSGGACPSCRNTRFTREI
jgi:DNA-directed RNA polymerase subunit RPC12/RpoP